MSSIPPDSQTSAPLGRGCTRDGETLGDRASGAPSLAGVSSRQSKKELGLPEAAICQKASAAVQREARLLEGEEGSWASQAAHSAARCERRSCSCVPSSFRSTVLCSEAISIGRGNQRARVRFSSE